MSLQELWMKMFPLLQCFSSDQLETIKSAVFVTFADCEISKKEQSSDIVVYENDNQKAIAMFFIAKKVEGLADKSLRYYRDTINHFLKIIQKPLNSITTDDVRYYLAARQIEDKISMTSIDNERRVMNSFFDWLATEDYVNKNPVKPIKKIRFRKKKKRSFTDTDIQKIKDACHELGTDEKKKRAIAIIEFLLSTGCRVAELCGLQTENINIERGTAIVLGKGNKERTVYLNEVSRLRLREYWECRRYPSKYCFSPLLKSSKKGLAVSGVEILVRDLGKAAGVSKCHPHRFRRTMATTAIKKGMSITDVQRILGHESLETTKIYLDLDDSDLQFQHQKYL